MVTKRWLLVLLLLGIAAGAIAWYCSARTTPEGKMRQAIFTLAECAGKASGEGAAANLLKIHNAAELFTDPARLELFRGGMPGTIPAGELPGFLARCRSFFREAKVSVEIDAVRLTAPDQGGVEFTGTLRGVLSSGESVAETREVRAEFQLDDKGVWRISRLNVYAILAR